MPLSTDIYQGVGQRSLAGGLAESINQFTENRARLSDLARQREQQDIMQGFQTRALQRAEEAIPAQQAESQKQQMEKIGREIDLGIFTRLQSGMPKEAVAQWAQQAGLTNGLKPEQIQAGLTPMMQIQEPDKLLSYYQRSAMPQEYAKAELEARFRKPQAQTALANLMAEREQLAASNPQDPRLQIYDQMIEKTTTIAPQMQIVTSEGGGMQAVTLPKLPGQRATVQSLGIQAVPKTGKGGSPEEIAAAKEQASLSSQQVLDQAEKLFKHAGRKAGTGASSWMGNIPGTEAKGFQANLETFKSQTFLPMVSALKGMGALSDAEGKKITASVGALDPQMPEKEFEESIKDTTRFLFNKAKAAGLDVQLPAFMGADKTVNATNKPQESANTITLPNGQVKTFQSAAAAQAFKKAAGL
jgi:hypothetical protein